MEDETHMLLQTAMLAHVPPLAGGQPITSVRAEACDARIQNLLLGVAMVAARTASELAEARLLNGTAEPNAREGLGVGMLVACPATSRKESLTVANGFAGWFFDCRRALKPSTFGAGALLQLRRGGDGQVFLVYRSTRMPGLAGLMGEKEVWDAVGCPVAGFDIDAEYGRYLTSTKPGQNILDTELHSWVIEAVI